MPIIGNPWAQDAATFGNQVGQNLSQGMLQLPRQRYEMALQQAQMRQALQQMAMTQQYRQQLGGIRQQQADQTGQYQQGQLANQQQGLQMRGQQDDMSNQIKMMMAQIAQKNSNSQDQYRQFEMTKPIFGSEGRTATFGQQQPQQQDSTPDWGPNGSTPPQQGLGQAPTPDWNITGGGKNGVPPPATGGQQLTADTKLAELYPMMMNSPMTNNPGMMNSFSNVTAQALQRLGGGGQATTNALQANPPHPSMTNSIPPQAIQMLRSNPSLRGAFEQKYGTGSSNQFLGQ